MGLSIEQSSIVLQKFCDKHQATMDNREMMVLQWCKALVRTADQGYWQGVQDGYNITQLEAKLALLTQAKDDIRLPVPDPAASLGIGSLVLNPVI